MDTHSPYSTELNIALTAIHHASLLTKRVLAAVDNGAMEKADTSPVTIADFGAQALIISALHHHFPKDGFIGEEDAGALRGDDVLCERVWGLVSEAQVGVRDEERTLKSREEMMDVIDLGGKGRVWILDPVDGTAAFMRKQQYAVCLALVVDGKQKLGVLGCPNLKIGDDGLVREDLVDSSGYGLVLSAVEGQGAFIRDMSAEGMGPPRRLERVRDVDVDGGEKLRWVESVASESITPGNHRAVAEKLGAEWPGTDLWSMQMKYVVLAVGACDVMVRIPPRDDYRACVWDHAGGQLIYREVGGVVTDTKGRKFDFGLGRRLQGNLGLVAASAGVHARVLEAVKEVRARGAEGGAVESSRKGQASGA